MNLPRNSPFQKGRYVAPVMFTSKRKVNSAEFAPQNLVIKSMKRKLARYLPKLAPLAFTVIACSEGWLKPLPAHPRLDSTTPAAHEELFRGFAKVSDPGGILVEFPFSRTRSMQGSKVEWPVSRNVLMLMRLMNLANGFPVALCQSGESSGCDLMGFCRRKCLLGKWFCFWAFKLGGLLGIVEFCNIL